MGMTLADGDHLGQLVPVPSFEPVDDSARDAFGPQQHRQGAGEILAMALLGVLNKVEDRVDLAVDAILPEGVAELAGVA